MRKILSYGTADQMISAFEQRIAVLEDSQDTSVQSATSVKGATRRSNFSRGTADQMLEAFESKIIELEGSDVSSSTTVEAASRYAIPYGFADVKKYLNGKLEFYGNEIEMDFGDGLKLANYLKKKGEQVNYCPSQETWSIPGECHWGDCYFYPYEANLDRCEDNMLWDGKSSQIDSATDITAGVVRKNNYVEVESNRDNADSFVPVLVDAVNEELEELDIFDSWTWEQQDSELILTTVTDSDVQEYTIPYADLQMDESNPEEDVQYIMKAITTDDTDEVTSATKIEASDKSVVIPASAKTQYYQDIGGGFGDTDAVYSLEDLMIIWNSECNSDPTMSQYESFNDWWQDTKQWMKPSSKPAEEVDDEMFTDNDGVFGNPGDIISKRDMRAYYEENCDSDPSLMDYNSFEDWWSATSSMLTPVTNSTSVVASYNNFAGTTQYRVYEIYEDGEEGDCLDSFDSQEDAEMYIQTMLSDPEEYKDVLDGLSGLSIVQYIEDQEYTEEVASFDVTGCTSVTSSTYDDDTSEWIYLEGKQVPDMDGFYTDYTLYMRSTDESPQYVCVFGDRELYSPDDGDFDYECDDETEAYEWFESYEGFTDEEMDELYSSTDAVKGGSLGKKEWMLLNEVGGMLECSDNAHEIATAIKSNKFPTGSTVALVVDDEIRDELPVDMWMEEFGDDSIFSETAINASEELTPEGFYQFFSVSAEPELMDRAAKILYEWYSNEGEEFLPEYVDILDMCDAADDETEKRIVLEAMGEEIYD